jgi:hypothetical protein
VVQLAAAEATDKMASRRHALPYVRGPANATNSFEINAQPLQRSTNKGSCRQLGFQAGVLPWAITALDDFTVGIDHGPEVFGSISSTGALL